MWYNVCLSSELSIRLTIGHLARYGMIVYHLHRNVACGRMYVRMCGCG